MPGDVAVTGFNDFEFSAFTNPSLTTVSVPGYEMGTLAAARMIDAIEGLPAEPRVHELPVELRIRQSS